MKEENKENKETQDTGERPSTEFSKEVVEKMLQDFNEEKKELNDKYVRLYAEFENYKKRSKNKINDIKIQTKYSTVKQLLNIVDDITLSRQSHGKHSIEDWADGALLIFDKIDEYIKSVGLEEEVCEIGSDFNPDKHDCITVIDAGEEKKDKIIDVVKRGYKIDGNMVKYPQVVVGK